MRVHELSKQVEKTSKELLALCEKLSIEVKSHMSALSDDDVVRLKKELSGSDTLLKSDKGVAPVIADKEKKEVDLPRGVKHPEKEKEQSKEDISARVKERIAAKLSSTPDIQLKKTPRRVFKKGKTAENAPVIVAQQEDKGGAVTSEGSHGHSSSRVREEIPNKTSMEVRLPITVGGLATKMEFKTSALIKALMMEGIFANVNQLLNEDIVKKIAQKFDVVLDILPTQEEMIMLQEVEEDPASLRPRAPVVTLMGHVDHGKTSLLDAVRNSRLVDREAGKITQHIGAYSVKLGDKGTVTFLDTPGHEAFSAMRARGANVTDVVVLVVAADDGVMPQTIEAISHAKAANVPIVVAINKSDLPGANPERVKAELQKHDIMSEDWGGKTIMVNVSALKRTGVEELLEMLLLEAEILELKANPSCSAYGIVLEARLSKSQGVITNVLITKGTLSVGDYVVCGKYFGKVRAMHNDLSKNVRSAGPSTPVEVFGIQGVPDAADKIYVVADEKTARKISEQKLLEAREKGLFAQSSSHLTLESLHEKMMQGEVAELKLIIKADVQGSIEVLKHSFEKLSTDRVKVVVVHSGVGGVNESDVMLATASDAIIIGFHVKAGVKAQRIIEQEGIDVRYYSIIYEAIESVKSAMEGKLSPEYKEVSMGMTEVREVFKVSRIGTIGGAFVIKGKIARSHKIRVLRDDIVVHEGSLSSLKRFKDDAREVKENYECGFTVAGFNDLKVGDMVESYVFEEIAVKL